jgi:caffeoyl-CoA O-methyltransferase
MPNMTRKSEWVSAGLAEYVQAHSTPPDDVLSSLADETAASFPSAAGMQIGPDQGMFMTLLTRITGARRALEVGTFTGYSSICIARGLPSGGKLTCCDVSEEWTSVARRYWQLAGVSDKIELRLAPAVQTLRDMPASESFDIAFIDADKGGYVSYWDEVVPRMRTGGVILVDNTLWDGYVADPARADGNVELIRKFNDHAAADDRVEIVMLTIGDGLTMARKN